MKNRVVRRLLELTVVLLVIWLTPAVAAGASDPPTVTGVVSGPGTSPATVTWTLTNPTPITMFIYGFVPYVPGDLTYNGAPVVINQTPISVGPGGTQLVQTNVPCGEADLTALVDAYQPLVTDVTGTVDTSTCPKPVAPPVAITGSAGSCGSNTITVTLTTGAGSDLPPDEKGLATFGTPYMPPYVNLTPSGTFTTQITFPPGTTPGSAEEVGAVIEWDGFAATNVSAVVTLPSACPPPPTPLKPPTTIPPVTPSPPPVFPTSPPVTASVPVTPAPTATPQLAFTGMNVGRLGEIGSGLLGVGAALVALAWWRRRHEVVQTEE